MKAKIFREHYVPKLDRRADALVLLTQGNMGFCFLLEAVHEEKEEYLANKIWSWKEWPDATEYLSNLFKVKIPHFDIITVRDGESLCAKLPPLG